MKPRIKEMAAVALGSVPNVRMMVVDSSTIYAPPRSGMSVSMVVPSGISVKPDRKVKTIRFGRLHTDERFKELSREAIPRKFLFRTVRAAKKFFSKHPRLIGSPKQMAATFGAPCKSMNY